MDDKIDNFQIPLGEISSAIEAILFASGEAVSVSRFCELLNVDKAIVEETINRLISDHDNNPWGGIIIRKVNNSYIMATKPSMKKVLERMFQPKMRPPLSQASYETLAVIAYNQPVTRAQIETVRGVSSDSIISRLVDRGWVCESGTLDAPGRPQLFSTTEQFLLEFGISSVDELPQIELMSYKAIRDLEISLQKASQGEDKQISMDSILEASVAKENTNEEVLGGQS